MRRASIGYSGGTGEVLTVTPTVESGGMADLTDLGDEGLSHTHGHVTQGPTRIPPSTSRMVPACNGNAKFIENKTISMKLHFF